MRSTLKTTAGRRALPVNWSECAWAARVAIVPGTDVFEAAADFRRGTDWLDARPVGLVNLIHWSVVRRCAPAAQGRNKNGVMNHAAIRAVRRPRGFTIVEMLVVISIIGILAGLLLPALARAKRQGQIKVAQTEMKQLDAAINQYFATYSRFPAPAGGGADMTFGYPKLAPTSVPTNSDVMIILADLNVGVNTGHAKNPQQHGFFNPGRQVASISMPGFSSVDYQMRDVWGTPYVITMDLNYDNQCEDFHYKAPTVSGNPPGGPGYNGLFNRGGVYVLNGPVMIWSCGPDRAYSSGPAVSGLNADNVLSWK